MPGLADLIHRAVGRAVAPEVIEARQAYAEEADDLQRAIGGDPPEPERIIGLEEPPRFVVDGAVQEAMNAQRNFVPGGVIPLQNAYGGNVNWAGGGYGQPAFWNPEPVRIEPPRQTIYPPPIEFKVDLAPATIEKIANRVLELLEEREAE